MRTWALSAKPIIGLSPGPVGSNHAGFIPVLGANGILWPMFTEKGASHETVWTRSLRRYSPHYFSVVHLLRRTIV
jgi:hypothetical protein